MRKSLAYRIITTTILLILAIISILPIFLVLMNSFKTHEDVIRNPLLPSFSAGFSNYPVAWEAADFSHTLINSFVYSGSTVLVVIFCAFLAAYVLAGRKVKYSSAVLLYFMVAMTVPVQLFLVPLYSFYANHKMLSNHFFVSLILAAVYLPLAISLLRTYILSMPRELEESARVDGAGTITLLTHIVLPLVTPGLITVAVIVCLNSWNDFLISSTFLMGQKSFTAMLSLMSLNGAQSSNDHGVNMAATMVLIGPVILIFIALQKYFIDGLVAGAVKG